MAAGVLAAGCEGDSGCIALGVSDGITVDVSEIADPGRVCIEDVCSTVEADLATFGDMGNETGPSIPDRQTSLRRITVQDRQGQTVADFSEVRLPQVYEDGEECGSYGSRGTITIENADTIKVSEDQYG